MLDLPEVHDCDSVLHGHSLSLIMRHIYGSRFEPAQEIVNLPPCLHTELGVEVAEWLSLHEFRHDFSGKLLDHFSSPFALGHLILHTNDKIINLEFLPV